MNRIIITLCLLAMTVATTAQPSWLKKTQKSIFTLKTFDDNGNLLASGNGVFAGEHGEAISSFQPFKGASKATVIDAKGNEYQVNAIIGASDTYDVAKFTVDAKKTTPATMAASAGENSTVWVTPFTPGSKNAIKGSIVKKETFGTAAYAYYTVRVKATDVADGMPLYSDEGSLLGLMQKPLAQTDTLCYAVSALFADSLKATGLSMNDPALRQTKIKKALPTDVNQALLTLFIAGQAADSAMYAQLVDDFIAQFPDEQDGYVYKAELAANNRNYDEADRCMEKAVKVAAKPDEAHYSYSRLIYQKVLYVPEPAHERWTMERAMDEAKAAYAINPLPSYRQQEAYILFYQKKFTEASEIYTEIANSQLRSPGLFLEASKCKLMANDTTAYLALLDSAVNLFSKPYLKEAAPYILTRAEARLNAHKYREATTDLNDYEQLMAKQVNDAFYYLRFQAETGGRLYQQALDDIAKAIAIKPNEEVYYAEKASLEVRVGLYDEAMATAKECIAMAPDYSDGHLFLGLALCMKGQKAEGVKHLQKAKELGDKQADALIEKYGKE